MGNQTDQIYQDLRFYLNLNFSRFDWDLGVIWIRIWIDLSLSIIAHISHVLYVIYSHILNFEMKDELIKIYFPMKICVFWFDLMDWIESGVETKIRVAIHDHIQSPISCSSPIPPQTLNPPYVPHQCGHDIIINNTVHYLASQKKPQKALGQWLSPIACSR